MITPSLDYRRTDFQQPRQLLKGLDATVNTIIGYRSRRGHVLERLRQDAEETDRLAAQFAKMTDRELHLRLADSSQVFRRGGTQCDEASVVTALAAIREAADRQLGLRPFLVQLMGALALHRGLLVEMATGEGKTLTAGLAAVLAGWSKRPCHIITVNDYLVQRDAEWLGPLYRFCGVKVGCVTAGMSPEERRRGYACDVTYATSKEVLADFLRDRLQLGPVTHPTRRLIRQLALAQPVARDNLVMRGLHTAIVDEADSVLIDEAVTPLIISTTRQNETLREVVRIAHEISATLQLQRDYTVNLRYREVELTPDGRKRIETACAALPGIWRGPERRAELIRQALVARELFHLGRQYVLSEGRVVIVDEFTGRPMPQRTWRQGLHQAIEAKESLEISDPTETIARLSFQRFFRLYHRLSGMTGTAREASVEMWQIYRLAVVSIPTHKPCIRAHWPDRILVDEEDKWAAIVDEVRRIHATGRPILIGTRSVAASEKMASLLSACDLHFRLLNAVRHQEEAQIIADAGQAGRITIATNMAGRGTDIKLGPGVAERGGLHVIATERHESGRVDRQLFGRSGRQGDPGSAQAFVSLDDELIQRFLSRTARTFLRRLAERPVPGRRLLLARAFYAAQQNAQRMAYRQRRTVLSTDNWMEEALSFAGPNLA